MDLTPIFAGRVCRVFVAESNLRNIVYFLPYDSSLRQPYDLHPTDLHFLFLEASRFFQQYSITAHTFQVHTANKKLATLHLQVHLPRSLYLKLARHIGFALTSDTHLKDETVSAPPDDERI